MSSRILIAENDDRTRGPLTAWLQQAGFACAVTPTANAVTAAERQRPDAALVWVDAPDSDPMRLAHRLAHWPDPAAVIVMSRPDLDIALHAARIGATDCLAWPTSGDSAVEIVTRAVGRRRSLTATRQVSAALRAEIEHVRDEMLTMVAGLHPRSVQATLLALLESRSPETYAHSLRVARASTMLARTLGVPLEQIPDIRRAALLHDIGKVAVPSRILSSRGCPGPDDLLALRLHVTIGQDLLATVGALAIAAELVGATHERVDGRGYPLGLKGTAIPLGSRIIAVADSYDAMTAARPYRQPLTHADANLELARVAGAQLDPDVVTAWIRMTESRAC